MMLVPCAVPDCARPVQCRGWCEMHYHRWYRTGSPLGRAGVKPIDRFDKYWVRVEGSGCWAWTGGLDTSGYGIFSVNGNSVGAHRWSYQHHVGPVPEGLELDHLCRVRRCVNPEHLEPVTSQVNTLRGQSPMAANARKTHCPSGHPYDQVNTNWYDGRRYCRACQSGARR